MYDAVIGDDGNAAPGTVRHERAGTVGAGAEPPVVILPEPLPEPGHGTHPRSAVDAGGSRP